MGDFEETDWYEVSIGRGLDVNKSQCLLSKWIECEKSSNIRQLWEATQLSDASFNDNNYTFIKSCTVKGAKKNGLLESVDAPVGMPLSKIKDGVSIWFLVKDKPIIPGENENNQVNNKSAFDILMNKNSKCIAHKTVTNKVDELYNDVTNLIGVVKFGDRSLSNAKKVMKAVADALWVIDGCQESINKAFANNHCKQLPHYFNVIYAKQYYDFKARKKAKPSLSEEKLRDCSDRMYDALDYWNNIPFPNAEFLKATRELAESLRSYSNYLKKTQVRMTEHRLDDSDRLSCNFQMPNISPTVIKSSLKEKYSKINDYFDDIDNYIPIHIDNNTGDFEIPEDRKMRYIWFRDLQICHRIQIYKYTAGGKIGNLTFIWKVTDPIDQTRHYKTVKEIEKLIPLFESRLEAKFIRDKYANISAITPVIRRSIVEFLTGKIPQNKADSDKLFEEFISLPFDEEEEAEIIYDKRKCNNGRQGYDFDEFYKELDCLLEEYGKAAEERRHSQTAHLPLAVSVPQLRSKVVRRLEEKNLDVNVLIPSVSTIRYQFNPGFLNRSTSKNYKCRFDIVCKIQRRQLRKFHEDAHYVNSYFLNTKSWCVSNRVNCTLVVMDDKAKIPVGEPGTPEAATSHMRKAITTKNITLEASDHNYHSVNVTPSVDLICDIPDTPTGSFYAGQVYVGIKDSIFEGSDPLRHVTELLSILRKESDILSPYLVMFTDGGSDHNLTFLYVQCMLVALFRIGDFDVLNVGRCAPYQSYINPAERVMSILNIGLQGLALERDHGEVFEKTLSSCQTMKSLRSKAEQHQGLKEAHRDTIENPKQILEATFSELQLKGKTFKIFQPLRDEKEVIDALHKVEPLITSDKTTPHKRASLKDYPSLEKFFENHLTEGLYMLQFRKCENEECCIMRSDSLPPPIPAPVLSPDGQHYLPFQHLYGKVETTEKDCPSLQAKKDNKRSKSAGNCKFLSSRVVAVLDCSLCGKPRCIYSMNCSTTVSGQREIENVIFSCGMPLYTTSLYTASYVTCITPVESAYLLSPFSKTAVALNRQNVQDVVVNNDRVVAANAVDFIAEDRGEVEAQPKRQSTLTSWAVPKKKKKTAITEKEDSETDDEPSQKDNDEVCSICFEDDPPGRTRVIVWVDCDICHIWAHSVCAKDDEAGWKNIRRKSWLCLIHNS